MADRIEREIEEILEKLDTELPSDGPDRAPISILSRKKKKPVTPRNRRGPSPTKRSGQFNPTSLMFTGAGLVVGGLVLSNIWGPIIWVSFAGVLLFIGAFLSTFFRSAPPAGTSQPQGAYWRDRYIPYESQKAESAMSRFRRKFRRQ
jgi:hypothetical protein